jgi:tRNA modification GTPase
VIVANKIDLDPAWTHDVSELRGLPIVSVSAKTGEGVDTLRAAIAQAGEGEPMRDVPAITNVRHVDLLTRARQALERANHAAQAATPEEFVLADLDEVRVLLEEVTGRRTSDDVLRAIFARFCIGK